MFRAAEIYPSSSEPFKKTTPKSCFQWKKNYSNKHLFRSSGRVVPPLAAGRSPTDEFFSTVLKYCFLKILIAWFLDNLFSCCQEIKISRLHRSKIVRLAGWLADNIISFMYRRKKYFLFSKVHVVYERLAKRENIGRALKGD